MPVTLRPYQQRGLSDIRAITVGLPTVFNRGWRDVCSVVECSVADVDEFIEAHYLHKRPAVCVLCLLMLIDGMHPVGCVVFSEAPRETSKRYGGKTWELARVFIADEVPRNAETWLIARATRLIKKNRRDVLFLVSYADPSANHIGTIYRAGNWEPDGMTDEGRKTPRFDYEDAITGRKYGRAAHIPSGSTVNRISRVSKYRFKYALQ